VLRIGVIGYGARVSGMARHMSIFGIPYRVTAVADPRAEQIKVAADELVKDAVFYGSAEELVERAEVDGIMIGTRCHLHTPMAVLAARKGVPVFIEKPVAVSFDQVRALDEAFRQFRPPVVVSFPLRVSPIALRVKEIIESGEVGDIEHVVAFNDVPYGYCYYRSWYRNWDEVQGLFLQKATHDLDYIHFLLGQKPRWLCAMNAQRVYGGDKPFDLRCVDCDERNTCIEGPFRRFHERFEGDRVRWSEKEMCMFADGVRNEDIGNCILEYENGAQASYTQNFYARGQSARRGARLYGYKGTIEFDWYQNRIQVFPHHRPGVSTIDFSASGMSHFGGDRELLYDFLMAMTEGRPSRTPISAGILSALTCLCARESAETRRFVEVKMR
jgi:predicted dehydrogenase